MMIRNAIFTIVLCALFAGPTIFACTQIVVGPSLPSWLSAEDSNYLTGGGIAADPGKYFSPAGFKDKQLQAETEAQINSFIPLKAPALLGNAAIQRSFIASSNAVFSWEFYPTFFGSDILYNIKEKRLSYLPQKESKDFLAKIQKTAKAFQAFSSEVDTPIALYIPSANPYIENNPAFELISDPLEYSVYRQLFNNADRSYDWIDGDVAYEEYLTGWHKTDHHWNAIGSYNAYRAIAAFLEFDDILEAENLLAFPEPWFYGTLARLGLCTACHDTMSSFNFDYPPYSVQFNGQEVPLDEYIGVANYERSFWHKNAFTDRYGEFYHGDIALIEISNPDQSSSGELLIIGDSYTNAIDGLLASSYSKTYVVDPRHTTQTARDFLLQHPDITQIIFIMIPQSVVFDPFLKVLE